RRRVQLLAQVDGSSGLREVGEIRLSDVEATFMDLTVPARPQADLSGLAERVVIRDVEDGADTALGVVRPAVTDLDRLHLADGNVDGDRLLLARLDAVGARLTRRRNLGHWRSGSRLRIGIGISSRNVNDGKCACVVQVPSRSCQRAQIKWLGSHQLNLPPHQVFADFLVTLDRDAGDDALTPFADRERDIDLAGSPVDNDVVVRADVVVTLAPIEFADLLE